jgi:hypothetical protein
MKRTKKMPLELQKRTKNTSWELQKRSKKMSWELPRLKLFWAGARKRDPRLGEVTMAERDGRIRML